MASEVLRCNTLQPIEGTVEVGGVLFGPDGTLKSSGGVGGLRLRSADDRGLDLLPDGTLRLVGGGAVDTTEQQWSVRDAAGELILEADVDQVAYPAGSLLLGTVAELRVESTFEVVLQPVPGASGAPPVTHEWLMQTDEDAPPRKYRVVAPGTTRPSGAVVVPLSGLVPPTPGWTLRQGGSSEAFEVLEAAEIGNSAAALTMGLRDAPGPVLRVAPGGLEVSAGSLLTLRDPSGAELLRVDGDEAVVSGTLKAEAVRAPDGETALEVGLEGGAGLRLTSGKTEVFGSLSVSDALDVSSVLGATGSLTLGTPTQPDVARVENGVCTVSGGVLLAQEVAAADGQELKLQASDGSELLTLDPNEASFAGDLTVQGDLVVGNGFVTSSSATSLLLGGTSASTPAMSVGSDGITAHAPLTLLAVEQRLHLSTPLPGASRVGRWRGGLRPGSAAAAAPLSSVVVSATGNELVVRLLHAAEHAGTSLTAQFAPGDRVYDEQDPTRSAEVVAAVVSGPSLYADAVHAPAGGALHLGVDGTDALIITADQVRIEKPLAIDPNTTLFVGAIRGPQDSVQLLDRDGNALLDVTDEGLDLTVPISAPELFADEVGALGTDLTVRDSAGNTALTFAEGPAPGGGVGSNHVVVHGDLLVTGRVVGELASEPLPPLSAHPTEQGDLVSFPIHTFQLPPFSVEVPFVGNVTSDLFTEALGLMQSRGSFGRYYTTVVPGFRGKVHSVGLCTDLYCSMYVELRNHTTNNRVVLTSSVLIDGGLHLEPTFTALLELTEEDTLEFGPADRIAVAFGQGTIAIPGVNLQAQLYLQADLSPVESATN